MRLNYILSKNENFYFFLSFLFTKKKLNLGLENLI